MAVVDLVEEGRAVLEHHVDPLVRVEVGRRERVDVGHPRQVGVAAADGRAQAIARAVRDVGRGSDVGPLPAALSGPVSATPSAGGPTWSPRGGCY